MKSHIVVTEKPVNHTGNNMLTRVILHTGKACFPVKSAAQFFIFIEGLVYLVINNAVFYLYIKNVSFTDFTFVSVLTATLRKKSSLVKDDKICTVFFLTGKNSCREFLYI